MFSRYQDARLSFGCGIVAFSTLAGPLVAAPLHLDFFNEIDGKPVIIDSLRYENSKDEAFSVTRLDWLATDFSLTSASGETLGFPGYTGVHPYKREHLYPS